MERNPKHKFKKRKARSRANQFSRRITYSPTNDKMKFTKTLRAQLQSRSLPPPTLPAPIPTLEIGSININGLSLESSWALEEIVSKYKLKVHSCPL